MQRTKGKEIADINPIDTELDTSTRSNYYQVELQMQSYTLEFDFEKEEIKGYTTLKLINIDDEPLQKVVLDMWYLEISKVYFRKNEGDKVELKDELTIDQGVDYPIGGKLDIRTNELWDDKKPIPSLSSFFLEIEYVVPKKEIGQRSGYFFVQKEQTFDQTHSLFYTQNEPIYLRTWLPTQDSPSVRISWDATIKVPKDLNVYMSGKHISTKEDPSDSTRNQWEFESHTKLTPGYFTGLVIGKMTEIDLKEAVGEVDYHVAVIFEESLGEKIENLELEKMVKLIQYAETYLDFEYQWSSFRMVIMPPNYPFEGAAHPGLTYVSPTVLNSGITGYNLVMGQVAASYFGNVITCSTWNNAWLNYGFQRFLERKMMARFDGNINYPKLDRVIGNFTMIETMKSFELGMDDTFAALEPDVSRDINPDDVISEVQYEKGSQFLHYLEDITSSLVMKKFLSHWVKNEYDYSVNWQTFKNDFLVYLTAKYPEYLKDGEDVEWNEWLFTPGLPPKDSIQPFESTHYDQLAEMANKILQFEGSSLPQGYQEVKEWEPDMQYGFLNFFNRNKYYMNRKIVHILNQKYDFADEKDPNSQYRWFVICAQNRYQEEGNKGKLIKFLGTTGRDSFLLPIYEALAEAGEEEFAAEQLERNLFYYNSFTIHQINEILGIDTIKKVKNNKKSDL